VNLADRVRYWSVTLLRRMFERQVWVLVSHQVETQPIVDLLPPAGYRLLEGDDLAQGYVDTPRRTERILSRLADARQLGVGLESATGLAYDTWIWRGEYLDQRTGILLDPGEAGAVLLDAWTHPAHRGRGLHAFMQAHCLVIGRKLGFGTMLGLVYLGNLPAVQAQRGAGGQAIKLFTCWNVAGLHWRTSRCVSWHDLEH
jgi:hypothetical protein